MKIQTLILGVYQTNCYIRQVTRAMLRKSDAVVDCLIIDPGLQAEELIDFLREHKLNPVAVALTHGHADHIAGLAFLHEDFPDVEVYIHKLDAEMLTEPGQNLSALAGETVTTRPADFLLQDGDIIERAGVKLQVLHTPGHTPGGICLYAQDEGIVFTDDTLFAESVGRTDFPGGDMDQLTDAIRRKLLTLPGTTKVYPGQGPTTTIAEEKKHNPFLK